MSDDLNCLKDRILAAAQEVARDRQRRMDLSKTQIGPTRVVMPPFLDQQKLASDELKPQGRVEDSWP